jgi:hypothetical protein
MSGWFIALIVYLSISSLVGLIYGVGVGVAGKYQLDNGDVLGWILKTLGGIAIGFVAWPVFLIAGLVVFIQGLIAKKA